MTLSRAPSANSPLVGPTVSVAFLRSEFPLAPRASRGPPQGPITVGPSDERHGDKWLEIPGVAGDSFACSRLHMLQPAMHLGREFAKAAVSFCHPP